MVLAQQNLTSSLCAVVEFWGAGEPLSCIAVLYNSGNVRLTGIAFGGDAVCNLDVAQKLLPMTSANCNFSKISTQDDFENGSISWSVTATAMSIGTNQTMVDAGASGSVKLLVNPMMAISMTRVISNDSDAGLIRQAGTEVQLLVTASNTGNVHLKNVTLTVPGLTHQLNCSSSLEVLHAKQQAVCYGSFLFDQDALEAGSKSFTASGNAANLAAGVDSNVVLLLVAAAPQLYLDVQGTNCTKPARLRKMPIPGLRDLLDIFKALHGRLHASDTCYLQSRAD